MNVSAGLATGSAALGTACQVPANAAFATGAYPLDAIGDDHDKNRSGDRDSLTFSIHFIFGSYHDERALHINRRVRSFPGSLVPWFPGPALTQHAPPRNDPPVWLARSLSVPAAPLLGGLHESALRGCGPRGGRPRRPRQVCAVH